MFGFYDLGIRFRVIVYGLENSVWGINLSFGINFLKILNLMFWGYSMKILWFFCLTLKTLDLMFRLAI